MLKHLRGNCQYRLAQKLTAEAQRIREIKTIGASSSDIVAQLSYVFGLQGYPFAQDMLLKDVSANPVLTHSQPSPALAGRLVVARRFNGGKANTN